jgi:hypothetical protein
MEDFSQQLRKGMEVYTSEGTKLGKVDQVWFGTSVGGLPGQDEEETCMEVHRGLLGRDVMYLPCRVVAGVDGSRVRLSVDEAAVRDTPSWHHKPSWITS